MIDSKRVPGIEMCSVIYPDSGGAWTVATAPEMYTVIWINAGNTAGRRKGEPVQSRANMVRPSGGDDWLLFLSRMQECTEPRAA